VQESVNEQRPGKIFADVKEVEITRALPDNKFPLVLPNFYLRKTLKRL